MVSNQRSFMGTRVLVTAVPSLPGTLEAAEDVTVQGMTKALSQPAFVGTAEGCSGGWAASIPAREGIGGTGMCQVDLRGHRRSSGGSEGSTLCHQAEDLKTLRSSQTLYLLY